MAKKRTKKIIKRKRNPDWSWGSLFTRKHDKGDNISVLVTDGHLILTDKELPENYRQLLSILENQLRDLKIEFQPNGSNKKYIINRPYDPKEARERNREMLSGSDYFSMTPGEFPRRRKRPE